ncbi:Glycoside hydrolase family 5 protein [Mycena sanguinolenta]|uniref:Glycoside hydrolase family 5 protein n=1 Tax=Mycena sanguinolenta TaxID=230812 RepID=A0A8H6U001_9AGAR|nr:Glycoside hydrolase family 5 protein [Mycena sanguinolenta]
MHAAHPLHTHTRPARSHLCCSWYVSPPLRFLTLKYVTPAHKLMLMHALLIGMHDVDALEGGDIYGKTYDTEGFYTNSAAINTFNQHHAYPRRSQECAARESTLERPLRVHFWARATKRVEPMIFDHSFYTSHLSWICSAALQIRNNVGDPNQLIFTGGGSAGADVQSAFSSSCAINVVAIHDYTECVACRILHVE